MIDRFYLICASAAEIERLVPLGVKTVQLRAKHLPVAKLRDEIRRAHACCAAHQARFILNDYWELALDLTVDFVHLGQEDMDTVDFAALRRQGVNFGLSTHDEAELSRALSYEPAYVALGPVYPTLLKKMPWQPQGLDRVTQWKKIAGNTPLVGIGGLTPERLTGLFAAGADSAAVVTDIAQAKDPVARCREWIAASRKVPQ